MFAGTPELPLDLAQRRRSMLDLGLKWESRARG
jgi:hypothetical protein